MSTEEKDLLKDEIRGINAGMVRTFVVGTACVCSTIIGGIVYLKSTLTLHDYKLDGLECLTDRHSDQIDDLRLDMTSLKTDINNKFTTKK